MENEQQVSPEQQPSTTTETPETATTTTRPRYSEEQQSHINFLIREANGRTSRDLRAELERVQEQANAKTLELDIYKKGANPELIAAREALAAERAQRTAAETRQQASELRALLREEADVAGFVNAADTAKLLTGNVRFVGGKYVVVDDAGNPRAAANGAPMQVGQLVAEFAASRPYAVKSNDARGGGQHRITGQPDHRNH